MSFIDNKKIFVAGGTGMAGAAVIRQLLAASPSVSVRSTYRSDHGAFIQDHRVEYVRTDLTKRESYHDIAINCAAAVMTAAVSAGAYASVNKPWEQVTDNAIMDSLLLEEMYNSGVKRVVFVSTASLYQDFSGSIREDQLDLNKDPSAAFMGVGWAKRYAEKLCSFWHDKTGMEILIGRAANIYGPNAKFNPLISNFIPALIKKAVDKIDPFEVWGSPEITRDVIYVDDFGRCIVAMLNHVDITYDIFNVGSGIPTTVKDVVKYVLQYSGYQPSTLNWRTDAPKTIEARFLDVSKAAEKLEWRASVTIEQGIRETLNWWIKNKDTWTR